MNQIAPVATNYTSVSARKPLLTFHSLQLGASGADILLVALASVLGSESYQYFQSIYVFPSDELLGRFLASVLFVSLLRSQGLYDLDAIMNPLPYLKRLWVLLKITLLILFSCIFLLKIGSQISRGSMISFAVLAFTLVTIGRVSIGYLSK